MKEAIRLTNKTAIALRKSAKNLRTAYLVAAIVLSLLLGAAGVALGLVWLPAVPIMVAFIALVDCGIMVCSRSRYLSLLAQAICAEAAARELRAGAKQETQQKKAQREMQRVKEAIREDVQNMDIYAKLPQGAQPFFEDQQSAEPEDEESLAPAESASAGTHRRRRGAQGGSFQLIRSDK